MRRDFIIDGLIFGKTTVRGNDSTEIIVSMFRRMKRNDINCILLGGAIISILNIVDGQDCITPRRFLLLLSLEKQEV